MNASHKINRTFSGTVELIWRTAINPSTFVVLSLLWCLDLGGGSVVAYLMDPDFSAKMDGYPFRAWLTGVAPELFPGSLWVYVLVILTCLMVASLLLCSINWLWRRRKRLRFLGEFLVHLGFLMIFSGFVIGAVWGERQQGVQVRLGGEQSVPSLGITLRLHDLQVQYGRDQSPLDTISNLSLQQGENTAGPTEVRLNHPLLHRDLVVYPRGSFEKITAIILSTPENGQINLEQGGRIKVGGSNLIVERLLQQDERFGRIVGPAALVRVTGQQPVSHLIFRYGANGHRANINGGPVLLKGFATTTWGNYDIHYDPGVRIVVWGAWLLALGIIWALAGYLRQKTARRDFISA